jgi:hypothetical protein
MSNELVAQSEVLGALIQQVDKFQVIKPEDTKFLIEHKEHLGKVYENVHIWRTESQKQSIISDEYHPTLHSKFHQAICEQKVQLDQAFYLAKDYEMKKISVEDSKLDLEEIEDQIKDAIGIALKRLENKRHQLEIEIQFKLYELKQMEIAMKYRMDEVKGWQRIEDKLIAKMKAVGNDDDYIWNKSRGEIESFFFQFLLNYHGIAKSTDGAESHNLYSLCVFGVRQAKEAGIFKELLKKCNKKHIEALIAVNQITQEEIDEWNASHS